MKTWWFSVGILAVIVGVSPPLLAQWPPYPTPGVPKTPRRQAEPGSASTKDGRWETRPDRHLGARVVPHGGRIDDPKAYTRPFSVRVNQRIMLDSELIEFVCNENNKSVEHLVGK